MAKKLVKEVLREASRQGWRIEEGRHYKLFAPQGKGLVVMSKTPGTERAVTNAVARMRRYGFVWKGR